MFKKILLVLLSLLLVSCDKEINEDIKEEVIIESEFIEPIRDVFLCDELNSNIKNKWMEINNIDGGRGINNYQIEMLYKDVYDKELIDINGNKLNLKDYDKLVINFVSVDCGTCKQEISESIVDIVNEYEDVKFIQYFGIGNKEEILNMYSSLNVQIPDNLTIVAKDDDFHNYIKYELKAEMYPTFVFYNNQKVNLDLVSRVSINAYKKAYDLAFINPIKKEELINSEGIYLFDLNRTIEDVKNDLSEENKKRIEYLDDPLYAFTSETTYKLMGKKLDFYNTLEGNSNTISEIDNYSYYEDKDLVIFYESLDGIDEDKINYINSLMIDDTKEYIVVLIEGFESQTYYYQNSEIKFNCPVVSNLGYMPRGFYSVGIIDYPTCIFIKEGNFTGAYGVIESIDKFNYALDTFLGENSIALKKNN